jgi:ADP-ribose pyrophosphatase YjhB (NUDIX family)
MPGPTTSLLDLAAKIWEGLGIPVRRRLTWLLHAKFIHGVSGIILDEQGRVLLLKHRFWTKQRWGLPGGLANHGETLAATLRRELREEAALEVKPIKVLQVRTRHGKMAEFILLAESSGAPVATPPEILEARFYDVGDLPDNLLPSHRELLTNLRKLRDSPGLPLEE